MNVESSFRRAMMRSNNRTLLGMNALLAWVAACDGKVTPSKQTLLRKFASTRTGELDLALDICRELDPDDLKMACDVVRELPVDRGSTFMHWAISVATADGRLPSPANFLLRFFADLTRIDLEDFYRQVTKRTLPLPGDPSSVDWWQNFEAKSQQAKSKQKSDKEHASRARKSGLHMTEIQAFAVLGLEQDASADEISEAFRRLAHVHHPDRFSQSSAEAQRDASRQFARIREAFETLTQQ